MPEKPPKNVVTGLFSSSLRRGARCCSPELRLRTPEPPTPSPAAPAASGPSGRGSLFFFFIGCPFVLTHLCQLGGGRRPVSRQAGGSVVTSLGGGQSRGSVRPIQPHRRHNLDMSQCVFTPMEDRVRFAAGWTEGAGRLDLDRQEGGHGFLGG